MEYKNLSAPFQASNSANLSPLYSRHQKASMVVDSQAASDYASQSTASTSNSFSGVNVRTTAGISPSKRLVKLPYDTSVKAVTKPIDAMM